MGNQSSYETFPMTLKMATQAEAALQPYAQKFEGCGNTTIEALNRLSEICEIYNIPKPQLIPDYKDSYFCGTIPVLKMIKHEEKYNTVWFTNINGKYTAHIYYSKP